MNEINREPNKYIDSYDNEAFAPQFWEDEKCTVITTQTLIKSVSEIA